ncbi:hypothetical protein Cch01nite_05770 [Cellulomonas chitinilytica]|uniref:FAD-binding FR-type domain-containing protein n=1 Tax=Cellulomonas chitinilytica TaxID=398759 RepID=A0A919TYL6_9CELL|nr:FAD-dependent oxidoreductase [Cellulomonas chitinilytica]GIG19853.1 hypothetical protein Cch01nite_05770 [Cellulomonas chitinilytica]
MTRIDAWLGRVTMYRTVSLALGAVVAVAGVLGASDVMHVDLVALLVSVVVSVGVVVVVSRVCGSVWRVRVHTESSVITGLILVLLFRPGLDTASLGALAGAAAVAAASKFVVAVRARHVVNPAAAGAFVVGLLSGPLGVLPALWWVATPALLPVVALAGLVVVLRTRRALLAGTYLGAAVTVVVLRQVAGGTAPADALWSSVASYPMLFAAAFMVTEPLTLPPRRWQQLTEAALVGVLTVTPFTVGPVWSTPELALVLGNVLAFTVGQRRAVRLRVVGHRQVTDAVREVAFSSERALRFRPGQWIELHLPHDGPDGRGSRRVFSVATPPSLAHGPSDGLAVAFRLTPAPSSFKRTLVALPPGDVVRATAVGGDFLLPRRADVPLLLVAGGIGITPFVSQLGALARSGEHRDVVLVLLLSPGDEPPYVEVVQAAGVEVVVVAPDRPASMPDGWRYVAGPLLTDDALRQVPDATRRLAYVSGPPRMVVHARRTLRRHGVRRVRTDAFTGY